METRQHHVLYIEDHEDTRDLVTLVLSERDYRVTTGATVGEALKLAREQHFDLFMLDSWLPDGSGIELCKQLRELDPGTPILFLSGAAYEADKLTAFDSGAKGYMIKPVDMGVLCTEVGKLIGMFPRNSELVDVLAAGTTIMQSSSEDTASFEVSSTLATVIATS